MCFPKLPKLAIFDMDGLIFDSERLFMKFLQQHSAQKGYTITQEDYLRTLGIGGDYLAAVMEDICGPDYPLEEVSDLARQSFNEYAKEHGLPVKPGIPELLSFFSERRIPCCVASSTHSPHVKAYLAQAGLLPFFSHVIGGEQVRNTKPDPEIFLLACAHYAVPPRDALVLEDSENGILAAYRAGIPSIAIPDMKEPGPDFAPYTACIAPSAYEVIQYFSED